MALVWASSPLASAVATIFVVLQSALPLIPIFLMGKLVDALSDHLNSAEVGGASMPWWILSAMILSWVFIDLLRVLSQHNSEILSQKMITLVQEKIHEKSISLDMAYYEDSRFFDTLHRAQREGAFRPVLIFTHSLSFFQNTLTLMGLLILLCSFQPWAILLVALALFPSLYFKLKHADLVNREDLSLVPIQREAEEYSRILTSWSWAAELRIFNFASLFTGKYKQIRRTLQSKELRLSKKSSLIDFAVHLLITLLIFSVVVMMVRDTLTGLITLGSMVMMIQAFARGQALLSSCLESGVLLYENGEFIKNYFELMDSQPRLLERSPALPIPESLRADIRFEKVSFTYPGSTRQVLKEVSFHIQAGECVSLVGKNGSGKSTIAKLLCRLYDPDEGSISINGIDLREFNSCDWRKKTNVILQNFGKYPLSLKDNITLCSTEKEVDSERLQQAISQAGLMSLIESLPQGIHTKLGKEWSDGEELSVGQWQKVALARAFYRKGEVVIFDEATHSLDAQSEADFYLSLKEFLLKKSSLIISHRLPTIVLADRILLLHEGRIAESGTHSQLLKEGKLYSELFADALKSYRELT